MSCHQYYEQRPVNDDDDPVDWDNMTLAEFMSYYEYSKRCPASESAEPLLDNSGYIYERKKPAVLRYFLTLMILKILQEVFSFFFIPSGMKWMIFMP